jgi:hypothetical protein
MTFALGALVLLLGSLFWHWHGIPYSPPPDQIPPPSLSLRLSLWFVWLFFFAYRMYRTIRHDIPKST